VSPVCGFHAERGKACCETGVGAVLAGVDRERGEQQKLQVVEYRRAARWRTGP
jgi:hypothetical protein